MKWFPKGCNEARERSAPGALRSELYISARRHRGRRPDMVDLAEVEDEAGREDGRDAGEPAAMVSIDGLGYRGLAAHGSMKIVT